MTKKLFREKTNPPFRGMVAFYSSTVYVPVYGKTNFLVGGQGTPGNPNTGGNYANTNPPTGGNVSYNPPTGGNYSGSNPPTILYGFFQQTTDLDNYNGPAPAEPPSYSSNTPNTNYYLNFSTTSNTTYVVGTYVSINPVTSNSLPSGYYFSTYNTNPSGNQYGTAYYSYYANSTTPGNPNYNPIVPGNSYYNPTVPGNANYNPVVPGNPGPSANVLGVPFPGGAGATPAPIVAPTPITLSYTPSGVTLTVPTGGYVDITNT